MKIKQHNSLDYDGKKIEKRRINIAAYIKANLY